jgi:hypothetical protein
MQLDPKDPLRRFWKAEELGRLSEIPDNPVDRSLDDQTWLSSQESKVAYRYATFKAMKLVASWSDDHMVEATMKVIDRPKDSKPVTTALVDRSPGGKLWLHVNVPPEI